MYSNRYQDKVKKQPRKTSPHAYFNEDPIALEGHKGGMVRKQRQQDHLIDLELRDYSYR